MNHPSSSTGSGFALNDFSSEGGEVRFVSSSAANRVRGHYLSAPGERSVSAANRVRGHYLSAPGGEVGERSEPGEVVRFP